jgi:Flp pilus assembly protein TadD
MRRDGLVVLGLIVLTVGVFWRVGQHEFVTYDDPDYITRNAKVQAGLTREGLVWAFGRLRGEATYWHPLTWLSHMLDCQWFGLKPAGHHLINLLFHTANGVLLFLALKGMTGAPWRSALVAALFAVHPLQVETVVWVAERKNVLSTFFWMLVLLLYTRYAKRPAWHGLLWLSLALALGLMAKPMLVTLPCALLLIDYWPLRRWPFSPPPMTGDNLSAPRFVPGSRPQLVMEKLPLFALALAVGVVTILAHRGLGMTNYAYGVDFGMRVENAIVSYVRYVGKTLWPTDLSAIYIHPGKWPDAIVWLCLLALIVASALILCAARRLPYLPVGWLWFLGTLVPVIGLIQVGVQAMANRFAYVPVIGLFIMLVWGMADLLARWSSGRLIAGLAGGAAVSACAVLSSIHLAHWKNSVALYQYAIKVSPDNFIAHNNLAFTCIAEGKLDLALRHVYEALRVRRDFAEAHYQAGLILDAQEKAAEALFHYQEAIRRQPNWALPHHALARWQTRAGKFAEATETYSTVLRLTPDNAEAHSELAVLLARQKKPAEAVAHYREALQLKPDWPEALNNLAWLLATHPRPEFRDGAEAVRLAARACELTGQKQAVYLGTLAAAHAEAGRFPDAVKAAEAARNLALAAGEDKTAETNRKLLELYGAGQPYREEPGP